MPTSTLRTRATGGTRPGFHPEGSAEDFRRAVRLGRLLIQDDVVYIQNLVGIALVRLGAESQRATALKALTALADDADGLVAAAAAEVLARAFDANALEARWTELVAGN